MALGLAVSGGPEMRYVAGLLRKAAIKDLEKERRREQSKAVRPLQQEIRTEAVATLPSGYGTLLAKSIRVTARNGSGDTVISLRVYARGKAELRDLVAVNRGVLRHPLFRNRKRWYVTKVRAGVVDRPVDRTWRRVYEATDTAHKRIIEKIVRS